MLKDYLGDFNSFSIGLVIVASLIGLARYRLLTTSLRYLTLLACFDALMESTTKLLYTKVVREMLAIDNNLFLFPFISIGEIVLLGLAYRHVLQSASFSKALPWLLGLFSAYALVVSFSQFGIARYAVGLAITVDLVMLGLAGLYFRKLLNELRIQDLHYDSFFWLSVGLTVYGLGNLLISLSSNYLLAHCSVQLQLIILWGVRILFNVLLYICYCVALWLAPPKGLPKPAASSIPGRT